MVEQAKTFLKVRLVDWVESWLLNLRQEYRAVARRLDAWEQAGLAGYLKPDLLGTVRVVEVDRIPNPSFFSSLSQFGLPVPWDFSSEPSLAVMDTIFLSTPLTPKDRRLSVLFHECVHLQQFQVLGLTRLVSRYIDGLFENGFNYGKLPMERQAHELQFRFDAGLKAFSVEREVEQALIGRLI
jgi:hypothetical protein